MMRSFRFRFVVFIVAVLAVSCAREQTESYDKYEDLSLEAWIARHRRELLGNKQDFGEASYYIDVLHAGDPDAAPVNDTVCWVKFDFSGRDLSGNIILTRRAAEARLAGTFTRYTHYVPYYRYCGTGNVGLPEATYLAMRNVQTLGEEYFAEHGAELGLSSREVLLRKGAKVVLYCPSRVVGDLSGTGGYEGQYSLASGKPVRIELTVCDTIKNPLAAEGGEVDAFCRDGRNGGLRIYNAKEGASEGPLPTDPADGNHPYNIEQRWVNVCDTVPQLYVDFRYTPGQPLRFAEPYAVGVEPYVSEASMEEIDRKIDEALLTRFHDGDASSVPDVRTLGADSVGLGGKARIWYVARLLDGFVVDTNIDEVKQIVYGEAKSQGRAAEYTPEEGGMIQAWYYTVPHLKYGQWVSLVTVSTHAYGAQGKQGSTTTSVSSASNGYTQSYYDYLNYMNYANSYYGSGYGYGGYYPGYYGGYMGGYYDPYYSGYASSYDTSESETVTTTSISTEILPFTPLLFQIYVEPAE